MIFTGVPKSTAEYGRLGSRALVSKMTYCIEGEYVTMRQIAARVGLSLDQMRTRFKVERNKPGAVTWDGLKRKKK